jgi:23S rRNA pseudouridine1911/1915/1917 synthase
MDTSIGRDPRHRQKMSGRPKRGRAAVSRVVEAEPLDGVTLVRVSISTGRTHQIRVHLSEAGHAVVGDTLYGGGRRRVSAGLGALNRLDRPFLHATKLTLTHPSTEERLSFEAPLPDDLEAVLSDLRERSLS